MEKSSLGRRLDRALLALTMAAQGPAVDPTRDQISSGKASTSPPPPYGQELRAWVDRAERLVLALERDAGVVLATKPRRTGAELREVIHQHEGRDPVYVAFVEGCSFDLVRKVRTSAGLDATTGEKREKPLTSRVLPETGQVPSVTDGMIVFQSQITSTGESGGDSSG